MVDHSSAYGEDLTELCERALVTLISRAGFWGNHLYLVGGLVPRYLAPADEDLGPHVGSRDVDLAIMLAVPEDGPDYETLMLNLRENGFRQVDPAFRWVRDLDGQEIVVEFLGESSMVEPGKMFRPRANTGSDFQALNVPGVRLLPKDHRVIELEADRLGDGARTSVTFRIANLLPFVTMKVRAYAQRHKGKDAYDLIHVLRAHSGGPEAAGGAMATSPVADDPLCVDSMQLLSSRFASPTNDAPTDYATFMTVGDDSETFARHQNDAVAIVDLCLQGWTAGRAG